MKKYTGRLACDGYGNLYADESRVVGSKTLVVHDDEGNPVEDNGVAVTIQVPVVKYGKNHGKPVAYDEGQYIFVEKGAPSHNERHHKQFVDMEGTSEENSDDNPHHYETQEDDPHFDADAPNKTRLKFDHDSVAATVTGHTEAYTDE